MLTLPSKHSIPSDGKEGISMPATITANGYIRVVDHGFDGTLTSWRNQNFRKHPETRKMLCDLFNQLILVGNFRPSDWFPKERAKTLVKNIAWTWIEHKAKRPSTIEGQTNILKSHIIPQVGNKSVQELTRQDFYWIREIHSDTYMAKQIRMVAQALLNWAWKEGMMDRQLFLPTVSVPRKPTPYIELKDRWRIYDRIKPEYRDLILLAIEKGMRIGEIVALRWDAIDFEHEKIKLIRSLSKYHVVDMRKGGDEVWLDMTEKVRAMLERRRQTRKTHWVFPAARGNHMWPNKVGRRFKKAARVCGLPHATLHHCRHSRAIDIRLTGGTLEDVQIELGHRSKQTSEKYVGLLGFRKLKAAVSLENQIQRKRLEEK